MKRKLAVLAAVTAFIMLIASLGGIAFFLKGMRSDLAALTPKAPQVILKAGSDKADEPNPGPGFWHNEALLDFWFFYAEYADERDWTFGEYRNNLIQIINMSDRVLTNLVVEIRMVQPRPTMQFASVSIDSKYPRGTWFVVEAKDPVGEETVMFRVKLSRVEPKSDFFIRVIIAAMLHHLGDPDYGNTMPIQVTVWSPDNPSIFLREYFTFQLEKTPQGEWR